MTKRQKSAEKTSEQARLLLELANVELDDEGTYVCENNKGDSNDVKITVRGNDSESYSKANFLQSNQRLSSSPKHQTSQTAIPKLSWPSVQRRERNHSQILYGKMIRARSIKL